MAQAGIHSLAGIAVRRWMPGREWLLLGIILGNLFPDTDNIAVAGATLAKLPVEGLHRTFTHSLFTSVAILAVFYLAATIARKPRWFNLGMGLAIGVVMHIGLDLLVWFNGVEVLWPIPSWINLWEGFHPAATFETLMLSAEFLFFALYFLSLDWLRRKHKTDSDYRAIRTWTWIQVGLFIVLTILGFVMESGFLTIAGGLYLVSLFLAIGVTIRMRKTIEAIA
ncbi:MAG: metal-dependent hydrolase [Chloroflexota bacterium]